MPTDRTKQLVYELDSWYRGHTLRQKDLAAELSMSAQQLAEILALRNRPTGEQALRIVEFLESQNMKTDYLDPRTEQRAKTRTPNPGSPRTLNEASETIEALQAELAQLKAAPAPIATVLPPAVATRPTLPPSSPTPKLAVQLPPASTAPLTAWQAEVARAHAAATANLSSKPITEQSVDELRSALNNEKDPAARAEIYATLRERKAEIAELNRNPLATQAKRKASPKLAADQAPPTNPAKDLPNFKKVETAPVPILKALPVSADTPFKITEILKLTRTEDLCSMLGNPVHTDLQRGLIYAAIQERRAIEAGRML